jgi:GNAT superfamily N-acetyltransferase
MSDYRVRRATLGDEETLVRHRVRMFDEMGLDFDHAALGRAFGEWMRREIPAGVYYAWLVEQADAVVAGGGLTVLSWPPGPRYHEGRVAFVYNVYTEPPFRRRGVARLVMDAMHGWCRAQGIRSIVLNASRFGQPLYEDMGYRMTDSPMMFLALD